MDIICILHKYFKINAKSQLNIYFLKNCFNLLLIYQIKIKNIINLSLNKIVRIFLYNLMINLLRNIDIQEKKHNLNALTIKSKH